MTVKNNGSESPLVSVIITCYNYASYLGEAIDSALSQTYPYIEIIVIDDGSTDNSPDIAKSFGKKIKYVRQENAGVVAARNNGAALAKGEYLCFLDADDYLSPAYLEEIMETFKHADSKVAYVYGDIYRVYDNGKRQFRKSPQYSLSRLMYMNFVPPRAVMRADAFKKIGSFTADDSKGFSFEDWELWLDFAENGYIGQRAKRSALSFYRIHGGGRNVRGEKYSRDLKKKLRANHATLFSSPRLNIRMTGHMILHILEVVKRNFAR